MRCVRLTVLDHRLTWFVDVTVRLSLPRIPSPITASVASMPSRSEPAAPGCVRWGSSARRSSCSSARWSVSAHARRAQLVPAGPLPRFSFRTNSLPTPEWDLPVGVTLARAHDDQSLARRRPRVIDAERDELSEAQPGRCRMRNRGRASSLGRRRLPNGKPAGRKPNGVQPLSASRDVVFCGVRKEARG